MLPVSGISVRDCRLTQTATAVLVRWACVATSAVVMAGFTAAPSAADPLANLTDAISSARGPGCPSLHYQPAIEQAALWINQSFDGYYTHTRPNPPISDPFPALKEAGYAASKALLLLGHAGTETDAIRGPVLEGYEAIPDCSYTDFGVSVLQNDELRYSITAVVLAAPKS